MHFKSSLIQLYSISLSVKCIANLTAIPRHKVLQISLRFLSNIESRCDFNNFNNFNAKNFSHNRSFKVASYPACYLTDGDNIRYLLENKFIAELKKWNCFKF